MFSAGMPNTAAISSAVLWTHCVLSHSVRRSPSQAAIVAVISGSLAFASLDRACRNLVPAFPQRSPPRHLAAAACGGLRSAPDCRTRRALLHLSYSYAPPVLMAALVSHGHNLPQAPAAISERCVE